MTRTTERKGKAKRQFWVGFVHGEIHFYRSDDYYNGVFHADLFSSKSAAKRCYEDVRQVSVRPRPAQKGRK